jgi:hypothetical protein
MRTSKWLGVVAAPVIALMIGACAGSASTGSGVGSASQTGSNNNDTQQQSWSDAHTNQNNLFAPISESHEKFDWMGKDGKSGDDGKSFDNNGGNTAQDNSADTSSNASNDNLTPQKLDQQQAVITSDFGKSDGSKDWAPSNDWSGKWDGSKNCFCDHGGSSIGDVSQTGSNNNWTDQSAWSKANTDQANIDFGIGGGANSATQSNDANTKSDANNSNATGQWLDQQQAALTQAFGAACGCFDSKSPSIGDVSQTGSNNNGTSQDATSKASTNQANIYAPISLWSHGSADVTQSNNANTTSNASNDNMTEQALKQDQAAIGQGFGESPSIGSVSQDGSNNNGTQQSSASQAKTDQTNIDAPITLWSNGGGSVSQSNNANTSSSASNSNATAQDAMQRQAAVSSGFGG